MRILFCNYEYPPLGGGGGVINALLAEELATRHEVTVLTSQGLGLPTRSEENGVPVVSVPVFFRTRTAAANVPSMLAYLPLGIRHGRTLIAAPGFDIVNTHFVLPTGPVGDALARHAGIPNVLSVHGGDLYDPSKRLSPHRHRLLKAWIRRLLRRADRVVGQSRNTVQNVHNYYDEHVRCDRIPLGIRRPCQTPASRNDYGFGTDDNLLVTVGRLVGRKAVDQLIEVMGQLKGNHAHLLIIGSGPQEPELRRQAETLGLRGSVHFLGQTSEEEKFRILNMSDAFVSTSQHEGFGLVFLEALACGLPVVCYDHGGQTDFLEDGQTGFVVPLNDRQTFLGACRRLVQEKPERLRMADIGRERVEELYIDTCAARYEELFQELLERPLTLPRRSALSQRST